MITPDFSCIRFIDDRSIDEKDFGKIQKARIKKMKGCAVALKKGKKEFSLAIAAANIHYAAFRLST